MQNKNELVRALLKEIEKEAGRLGKEKVHTIYFGGGTPSLLTVDAAPHPHPSGGTRRVVPDGWHPTGGTRRVVPDGWHPTGGTRRVAPDGWHPTGGTRRVAPDG
ncbi:hypothetical protein ACFSQD_15635 [Flavihumibacter stibioxidans]|uniref:hypothetical protein n=1 Tax=Flavihumibacter stibioxidans TaxID=1834163 RepID=UPI003629071C